MKARPEHATSSFGWSVVWHCETLLQKRGFAADPVRDRINKFRRLRRYVQGGELLTHSPTYSRPQRPSSKQTSKAGTCKLRSMVSGDALKRKLLHNIALTLLCHSLGPAGGL